MSPSPTPGLPTAWSSVRIRAASAVLPMVRISSETRDSRSTTSSRWYIASDSVFARAEHVIPYFLVGSAVTRWYIRSLIDHRCFSFSSCNTISTLSRLLRPLTYWVGFLGSSTCCFLVEGVALAWRGVVLRRARRLDARSNFVILTMASLFSEVCFVFLEIIGA